MTIVASGELFLGPNAGSPTRSIASEFGGSAPYDLQDYYRGGSLVPDTPENSSIPTSGAIDMQDFYGATAQPSVFVDSGNIFATAPTSGGSAAEARITYSPAGTVTGSVVTTGNSPIFDDWLISGSASDYEIRATVSQGSTPSGSSVGVWLPLTGVVSWFVRQEPPGTGTTSTEISVSIRVAGGTVLSVGVIGLTATRQL